MTRGGIAAFAAGFVGALVVVGLAARSRLTPQGEAIQRRLAADGAALKAEADAFVARETARLSARGGYGERKVRAAATDEAQKFTRQLGIPQITEDLVRLQGAIAARKAQLIARGAQVATLIDEWNPFNLLR